METITLEQLQKLFADLRAETSWDVDGEMLWGYYFISTDANKLTEAGALLASEGYDVAGVYENEDEPGFILHVQKYEAHTPDSLFARNAVLEQFAKDKGLDGYDGMDVSPADDDEEGGFINELDPDFPTDETKVTNPGLVEAMDTLNKSPDDEEAQFRLGLELERAFFLIPVAATLGEDEEGAKKAEASNEDDEDDEDGEGSPIIFMICGNDDGEEYLPLFTDLASLKEWAEPSAVMILSAAEAWDFILSEEDFSGAVINPQKQSLELDIEQIELLAEPHDDCGCGVCDDEEDDEEESKDK